MHGLDLKKGCFSWTGLKACVLGGFLLGVSRTLHIRLSPEDELIQADSRLRRH